MSRDRILIVDDEPSIRYTFSLFLEEAGYEPIAVAGSDEALLSLSERSVDLALVDILLEDSSGIDLLAQIKKQSPATEVVIITGAPSIDTATDAVRLGAFDYLVKPVRQEALLRVTELALRHRRVRVEAERYRLNLEAIFRSLEDGVVTVDEQLKAMEVNQAAERLCGLDRDRVVGSTLSEERLPCRGECLEIVRRVVATREPASLRHLECGAPQRSQQIVSVTATPLLRGDGGPPGAVMVVRDQSRLVELERRVGDRPGRLVGVSPALRRIRSLVQSLADLPTTVLITGESGTGKEVVADALHTAGHRRGPLVKVNCSALSEELLESELFGHVKGAFTGALKERVGRFQMANGGTLLLDEIGEMSPRMQLRFLRVLETMEFERVGDSRPIRVDVRILAATNRDLEQRVKERLFREDLYFRLKVFEIPIPPLRERREDIPPLVHHLLKKLSNRLGKSVSAVSDSVLQSLLRHPWPGNVRELKHVLEHALILARGDSIEVHDLPRESRFARAEPQRRSEDPDEQLLEIRRALELTRHNKTKAAEMLGVSRRTLYRRLERLREAVD